MKIGYEVIGMWVKKHKKMANDDIIAKWFGKSTNNQNR